MRILHDFTSSSKGQNFSTFCSSSFPLRQARSLSKLTFRASGAQCRHRKATRSLRLRPLAAAQSDSSFPTGSIPSTSLQGASSSSAPRPAALSAASSGNGVFCLLLANVALFALDHLAHLSWVPGLYLYNAHARWWQFITCSFCHGSFEHLSGNMFMLYVFGRIVEEEEGVAGVWGTYLICALGASIATLFLSGSSTVSLGASGAVFGMFTMAVLTKLRFNFKKLLECAILGQFVVKQVMQEVQAQASKGAGLGAQQIAGVQVGHIAHIAGALAGVLLVLLLSRIPDPTGNSA